MPLVYPRMILPYTPLICCSSSWRKESGGSNPQLMSDSTSQTQSGYEAGQGQVVLQSCLCIYQLQQLSPPFPAQPLFQSPVQPDHFRLFFNTRSLQREVDVPVP